MSTDTFSDIETRLRSELPRLADTLVASGVGSEVGPDDLQRLEPEPGDRHGRRRGLIPAIAVAALGLASAQRHATAVDDDGPQVGAGTIERGPPLEHDREAVLHDLLGRGPRSHQQHRQPDHGVVLDPEEQVG